MHGQQRPEHGGQRNAEPGRQPRRRSRVAHVAVGVGDRPDPLLRAAAEGQRRERPRHAHCPAERHHDGQLNDRPEARQRCVAACCERSVSEDLAGHIRSFAAGDLGKILGGSVRVIPSDACGRREDGARAEAVGDGAAGRSAETAAIVKPVRLPRVGLSTKRNLRQSGRAVTQTNA